MTTPHRLFSPSPSVTLTPSQSPRARIRALEESYVDEITQTFHVFDEKRTGTISLHHLKLLIRALGFRVTQPQVLRDLIECKRKRNADLDVHIDDDRISSTSISNEDGDLDIDLDLVLDVMEAKYNKKTDANAELKINFKLFDADNKGYINTSDIKRVIHEINTESEKMTEENDNRGGTVPIFDLREDQINAMIDEFDGDQDSVLNFQEFKKIMQFSSIG